MRSDRHGHPVVTREVAGSSPAAPANLKEENAMTQITKGTLARLEAPWLYTNPSMTVRVQSIDGENITLSSKDVELGSMPAFDDAYDFSHLPYDERVTLWVGDKKKRLKVTSKMGGLIMLSPR